MSNTENQNQTDPNSARTASGSALTVADQAKAQARPPAAESDNSYISVFQNERSFAAAQRMALALATSDMVPPQYQGQAKMGNILIALELSQRNRWPILTVMQNLNIIHGRPSWGSSFVIGSLNSCGRFSPIEFAWQGTEGQDDWGCRATATVLRSGNTVKGSLITIAMAKSEGWYAKSGSKWKTMPEQMLQYRAGSFFAKIHAPEILNGMQTVEEEQDIDSMPNVTNSDRAALPAPARAALPDTVDATVVPVKSTKAAKGVAKATQLPQPAASGEEPAGKSTKREDKTPDVPKTEEGNKAPDSAGQQVGNEPAVTPPPAEEKPAPAPAVETPAAETPAPAATGTVAWKEVNVVEVKTGKKASNNEKVWILRVEGEVTGRIFCELSVATRDGEPPLGDIWIDTEIRTSPATGTEGTPDFKPAKENTYITAWKQIEI